MKVAKQANIRNQCPIKLPSCGVFYRPVRVLAFTMVGWASLKTYCTSTVFQRFAWGFIQVVVLLLLLMDGISYGHGR